MSSIKEHKFGGNWTLLKLELLERYLEAFNTALQRKPNVFNRFRRIFIDAFAGTGECSVTLDGQEVKVDGSAKIALDTKPAFDRFYFVDLKSKHVKALNQLASNYAKKDIRVLGGDCNIQIGNLLNEVDWKSSRAVMFLDPYGMSVKWETLEKIAATKAIDLWYLFPISAVCRQAAHNFQKVDENKSESLTTLFGTANWVDEFYKKSDQDDLFSIHEESGSRQRVLDQWEILKYFQKRLNEVFPVVLEPALLPDRGAPIFALFFMSSNPSEKAIALTRKIAGHLLNLHSEKKLDAVNARPGSIKDDLFK